MKTYSHDAEMMRRAIQLAEGGGQWVSPNPLVGAVVEARGRIIGEGFHRQFGGPHAEVNAIASVSETDRPLLREATIYVTLEPCSHYGKTPPCAKLIIDTGIPRVVVGAPDPNPLVAGRGIKMLREAGVDVTENVLKDECMEQNRRFMTAQTQERPWIQLKWAQTLDGDIAGIDSSGTPHPISLSSPLTLGLMHQERGMADAILVGTNTINIDNPSLTIRHRAGRDPYKITFESERLNRERAITSDPKFITLPAGMTLESQMKWLRKETGIQSLMVEGGRDTLQRFIDARLFDEIRIETAPRRLSDFRKNDSHPYTSGLPAPILPPGAVILHTRVNVDGHTIDVLRKC